MSTSPAQWSTLEVDVADQIAVITLNRPDRLNAITADMCDELTAVLHDLAERSDVRALILTGAGRAFCAGADVVGGSGRPLPIYDRYTFFNALEDHPQPTIAAINGACIGGGLELALCCDFRVADENARIGLGEVKLGVIPAGGGTARLPRLIGPAKAKEFLYFGDHVNGEEAAALGIVSRAVPATEVLKVAHSIADRLSAGAPRAIRAIKQCVNVGMQMGLLEATQLEGVLSREVLRTADAAEGMRAFAERRPPRFKGE